MPASEAAIPNSPELSLPVQVLVDPPDANAAVATPHPNYFLLLVIEEPILARLEAGNDRMPCFRRMFGGMLARRTIAATDVSTLRRPTEMKPPSLP